MSIFIYLNACGCVCACVYANLQTNRTSDSIFRFFVWCVFDCIGTWTQWTFVIEFFPHFGRRKEKKTRLTRFNDSRPTTKLISRLVDIWKITFFTLKWIGKFWIEFEPFISTYTRKIHCDWIEQRSIGAFVCVRTMSSLAKSFYFAMFFSFIISSIQPKKEM